MNPEKQSLNKQNSIDFKRLFLGFSIPANQTELLTALQQQLTPHLNPDAKAIAAENFHLTLLFLGGFPTAQLPQLLAAIDTLKLALFNQTLTSLDFWPGPKILCLKGEACPNLADLAEQVSTQLAPLIHNQARTPLIKEHCYTPHISLFRKATRFNQHQAEPCLPERQINLAPRELHLYESRSVNTEQNGKAQSSVQYQILHSWPLMPMISGS